MRRFKKVVYFGGVMVSSVAMLPLPWRVRVTWYALVGRLINIGLGLFPSVYSMLADDSVRYKMGKADHGQMESIKVLELVVKEIDSRRIPPADVAKEYEALKAEGVTPVEIPYALAKRLLDEATQSRLLKHIKAE